MTALVAALGAAPVSAQDRPVATTAGGRIMGVTTQGVQSFKGIPYAAPPVGPLRWRPPAAAAGWRDVRDGSSFGAACPQPRGREEAWARVGKTSEDCLFLNVWRPARAGRYPVMVFLHGGGFTYGSAGVPLYDGANLARRGAVIVTINYRLGLLGFFAHPALTRDDPAGELGNYGVMDAVAALRWVRANAAAFGGDPDNVTLFGESAGAGIVQVLMGSPAGAGLFHKAVSQSGSGGSVLTPIRGGAASAEEIAQKLTDAVGLRNVTAAQLRALPVDRVLSRSFPFVDGKIVVASPGQRFDKKQTMRIPLLIGANSNEATLAANNEATTRLALGASYERFLRGYVTASRGVADAAKVELAEDALSVLPSMSIAALHAGNDAAAYAYLFDQVPANLRAKSAGTPHGGEMEYLFGNPYEGSVWDAADHAVSQEMGDRWVAFARTGKPDLPGKARWTRVPASGPLPRLEIGTPNRATVLSPLQEEVRTTSLAASRALWNQRP